MIETDLESNEVQYTSSNYAPGSGPGEVDIRGYDNYPLSMLQRLEYVLWLME